jgi:hypothetical protein
MFLPFFGSRCFPDSFPFKCCPLPSSVVLLSLLKTSLYQFIEHIGRLLLLTEPNNPAYPNNVNPAPCAADPKNPNKRMKTTGLGFSPLSGGTEVSLMRDPERGELPTVPLSAPEAKNLVSDELRRFRIEKQLNWSIKLPSQSLDWWREHQKSLPHLAILAKSYLAIPATSAPSERIFSTASIIGSKRRANLQPQKLEKLIFLNKNIKRAEQYFN